VDYRQVALGVRRHSLFQVDKAELEYNMSEARMYLFTPKRGRGTIRDDWFDPAATPPEWTDQRVTRLDVPCVEMQFRTALRGCQRPEPDKVFPMISMSYTPEGASDKVAAGLWAVDYTSLHQDDLAFVAAKSIKNSSGEPIFSQASEFADIPLLRGLFIAKDFQKGEGEVFAKRTYSKNSTIPGVLITVEDTTIEIVHDPVVRNKPPLSVNYGFRKN
jgi:hypothetical protein